LHTDPHFRDYLLFYEYFDGDSGRGVGASHQTGWTGLIAKLLMPRYTHTHRSAAERQELSEPAEAERAQSSTGSRAGSRASRTHSTL
jgi:hypothetical protein